MNNFKKPFVVFALILGAAGTLTGTSFLRPCHGQSGSFQPHPVTIAATTAHAVAVEADADDVPAHWEDPKYSHESTQQITALVLFLTIAGLSSSRRRVTLWLRRNDRHA